jgi:hypothetical protein
MLPEQYQSPAYWDDEAAMRAFLDDVERLAIEALQKARYLDTFSSRRDTEYANELHAAASVVCPGIEDRV